MRVCTGLSTTFALFTPDALFHPEKFGRWQIKWAQAATSKKLKTQIQTDKNFDEFLVYLILFLI